MDVPDEPKNPPQDPLIALTDRVVSRVAAVWVWTVLFAATATVTFTQGLSALQMIFSSFNLAGGPNGFNARNSFGMIVLSICAGAGAIALAFSWWAQYRYFRGYILQHVVFNHPDHDKRRDLAMRDLSRAYFLLILAAVLRLFPDLLSSILNLLTHP